MRPSMMLDVQQEERACQLHKESFILFAHDHWLPPAGVEEFVRGGITGRILMTVVDARIYASTTDEYHRSIPQIEGWFSESREVYLQVLAAVDSNPNLMLIRNSADVLRAKRESRVGVLLGAEGGKIVEHTLSNLPSLYDLGVRHIMLSWAFNNQITAGESDKEGRELTAFGREVVQEMNRLGMIIDITHISRPAMREVLELSSRPVLNSHTTLKSISHRIPSLTEEEIRAVADRGGVLAVHFMTHMITGRFRPQATIDELLAHIDAIVNIGGIDCVALGPDYLPNTSDFKRNTEQTELSFPIGLESPADILNLVRALVMRGYSDEAVRKILGGNLLRLFREVLDN
ncbi:MAG TPA: membrane dipeptidase [Candidatus Dormibacteraeota bacterium]|nr:membrane dipeptidase [Candidatus Dormibacteraeota bacterium]